MLQGKVLSVDRLTGPKATGETCDVVIETKGEIPYWEGQSYGVVPPVRAWQPSAFPYRCSWLLINPLRISLSFHTFILRGGLLGRDAFCNCLTQRVVLLLSVSGPSHPNSWLICQFNSAPHSCRSWVGVQTMPDQPVFVHSAIDLPEPAGRSGMTFCSRPLSLHMAADRVQSRRMSVQPPEAYAVSGSLRNLWMSEQGVTRPLSRQRRDFGTSPPGCRGPGPENRNRMGRGNCS